MPTLTLEDFQAVDTEIVMRDVTSSSMPESDVIRQVKLNSHLRPMMSVIDRNAPTQVIFQSSGLYFWAMVDLHQTRVGSGLVCSTARPSKD